MWDAASRLRAPPTPRPSWCSTRRKPSATTRWAGLAEELLTCLDGLVESGAPIQAVGLQSHLQPSIPFNPAAFDTFLTEIERRNLDIYISSSNVDDASFPDDIAERDKRVAETYHQFLSIVLPHRRVKRIVTWGMADPYSFYVALARQKDPGAMRLPRPLLLDEKLARKPAWFAVERALREAPRAAEARWYSSRPESCGRSLVRIDCTRTFAHDVQQRVGEQSEHAVAGRGSRTAPAPSEQEIEGAEDRLVQHRDGERPGAVDPDEGPAAGSGREEYHRAQLRAGASRKARSTANHAGLRASFSSSSSGRGNRMAPDPSAGRARRRSCRGRPFPRSRCA